MTIKILSTEDTHETGKFGVDMPHVQSTIHSDYDSAESIADSDLADGELRKMLASPLNVHGRGENNGSSHKPRAKIMQKRGASAQRTQADHSRRESLKSSSSQEARASGKPDALFSSRSDEPGTGSKVLCSNMLIL